MDTTIRPFEFDNSFAREMPGFYVDWKADKVPNPQMSMFNSSLAKALGPAVQQLNSTFGATVFSGNKVLAGSMPIAQVYAGHQFGGFSAQLGDGRALLLGEFIDQNGRRRDIQLKGSGKTPFSRGGDGKAALGPILREYLVSEAMHALGIPTTRALAATTTGEKIMREVPESGAILTRIASSHLRVGTFQYFAARRENDKLKQLANYAITRHYPALQNNDNPYLALLNTVAQAHARLVAAWSGIGFAHGVMNTDNTSISGETIDYGPCAFIDAYNPNALFSSIDTAGRYAFGNQANMAQWNLARFAEALLPLIDPDNNDNALAQATAVIVDFPQTYKCAWRKVMCRKIGLSAAKPEDDSLIENILKLMHEQQIDYTLFFRSLAHAVTSQQEKVLSLFAQPDKIQSWLQRWMNRCRNDPLTPAARHQSMLKVNPVYIPRNHLVEAALQAASAGNMAPFKRLFALLEHPYTAQGGRDDYKHPAPAGSPPYKTFCGT